MALDVLILSRVQFALTVMFHYIFPPLSIGLGVMLVFMEGLYLRTRDKQYEAMTRFWTKIFAVNFAMGVASGIVMEFQFGTNWATYSRYVGDVFGSALAAEGIFAFFLESGFLAVLVFGWDKVSPRVHFFSTVMVSLGSIFSAVWIVVANSWQQTPQGFHIVRQVINNNVRERAEITDFWAMVFNPSSMQRLTHTLLGAFILGAFFVMSISAYYILKGRHLEFSRKCFRIGLVFAAIVAPTQLLAGHWHAKQVAATQPAKLATYEGHFQTGRADLHLFGWPNAATGRIDYGVSIPGGLSYLVKDDPNEPVQGLNDFKPADRPPLLIPFFSYHIMIALGLYFIALSWYGLCMLRGGRLWQKRWLLWVFVVSVVGPFIANQLGWIAAEVGRQPWVVYGLLRTSNALSKAVEANQVLSSIVLFMLIYVMLGAVWVYVLNSKIQQGPGELSLASGGDPNTSGALPGAQLQFEDLVSGYSLTSTQQNGNGQAKSEGKKR